MEVKGMRLRSIEPELRKAETRRGLHITSSRESIDCVIETHSRCQLPQNKASRVQNIEAPTKLHMACRRPWDKKIILPPDHNSRSTKIGLTGPLEASERPPERLRGPFGYIGACFEP